MILVTLSGEGVGPILWDRTFGIYHKFSDVLLLIFVTGINPCNWERQQIGH